MRLLSLSEDVKAIARQTKPDAAAMRALGTLAADDQLALVRSIKQSRVWPPRLRRIARKVISTAIACARVE